jgi:hypothetical protein
MYQTVPGMVVLTVIALPSSPFQRTNSPLSWQRASFGRKSPAQRGICFAKGRPNLTPINDGSCFGVCAAIAVVKRIAAME